MMSTAEIRRTLAGATVVTLKNIHLATPTTTLGLEAAFSLESDGVECKLQVTWGGEVVVLDGRMSIDESEYQVSLEMLLPSHPHLDTRLLCITSRLPSQVSNNLTLMVGPESTRSEFQVTHSTVWHIADMDDLTSDIMATQSRRLSFTVDNKLSITSEAAAIDWQFDHTLEINNKALEILATVRLADTSYIISANFYDQSEALLKYHTELELSLGPQWHFSYSDTLEQVREGEWVGRSYAQMPSSRQYTTISTLARKSLGSDGFLVESQQELLVEETKGGRSWIILGEETFTWTISNMSLKASLSVENVDVFSLEASLEGTSSSQLDLHLKSWLHNLFECQVVLGSKGLATDLSFMLLIIPFNKEIRSTVAVGQHNHCSCGTVDGQVAWGGRGVPTHTLALSFALYMPQDSHPLELRGSMSLLGVAWDARLEVVLAEVLEDTHRLTFTFILPDQSKFEMGSRLNIFADENALTLLAGFHLHLPAGEKHNVTLAANCINQEDLTDAKLKLHIDSPISQEVIFLTQVKNQLINENRIINFTVQTHSEANYWLPINAGAAGWWNSSKAETEVEVHWGNITFEVEGSGGHRVVEGEHQVEIEGEVRRPMATTWRQLKSSVRGSFSIAHNPAKLKVTQEIHVEKDEEEVFKTSGEVKVSVPQVEGRLTLTHSGAVATTQAYKMDVSVECRVLGKFTGREMEVRVAGSIDGEPVRLMVHYEDGQQARVHASYRSPHHFTLAFTTHLRDISIGIRKGGGTTYSLNTEGELVYHGHSTKMLHQLSISRNQASSNITFDPFLGSVFKLSMTRTKLDLNEWETDVELSWGERVFSYQDKVRFPSLSDFSVQVQVDAPEFYLHQILALVEAGVEAEVGQGFRIMLSQHNITMHNARIIFYNYEAGEEHVWEAGVRDIILYTHAYRDLCLHHTFIPLAAGLEVKSNMTLGETPVVVVGVKVAEHTRELLLGFCSTSDECVQLHVHAHARDTLSTRTFTLDAHALNSLFWKSPQDPLIQNSILIVAQHTPDRTMVSGGLLRVECAEVYCISSTPQNMLHATLLLTHDTLDLTVNTTERTIMMTSKVRENKQGELLPTNLPGGRLTNTATLESCLWLDKERDPQGAITWNSNMAAYTSARATERVFRSSLTHPSIAKPLVVEGRMQSVPSLTSATLVLDVFSQSQDSLVLHLDLKQDRAQYLLSANLSKSAGSREHVMGIVVTLLPSPDNGEVSVALLLPPYTPTHSLSDLRFTFHCKMITKLANKTLSCKARTATVNEEVSIGYHRGEGSNCLCGGVWLALLNRTFTLRHRSCHDLPSSQTAVTRKAEGDSKKELALKFGLVDPLYAELELLGSAGVNVQLHPPFLLHATAYHTHSIGAQWHHVILKAGEEIDSLTTSAKTVFQAVVADAEEVKGFSAVSSLTPATSLARYLRHHASRLTLEAKQDQLMLDIAHGAQACVDITSVLLEGAVAYVSYNYGSAHRMFMEGAQVLVESAIMNTGAAIAHLSAHLYRTTITTLNIIADLPTTIFNYALSLPIVSKTHEWISAQLQLLQESPAAFALLRNTTMKALKFLQVVLALIYKEGDLKHRVKSEEVWTTWVPLTECSHSLPEVWQTVRGTARFTPHSHSLTSTLLHWWHLLTHPLYLLNNITPPFPAEGAIIGDKNFVSVDGRTFSLAPALDCSYVLLTDSRDRLFTVLASWDETRAGTNYTLLLINTTVRIQADLQVTINSAPISLPYLSDTVMVMRDDHKMSVAARDSLGREVLSVVCWTGARRTCVVGVSGWLHGDTRALLGSLNLDPANDFMRPSGKVTQSKAVFKKSWQVGSGCVVTESTQPEPHPSTHSIQLCKRFLLHYTSPVFACHETVNIRPYYDTCLRYLTSLDSSGERAEQSNTASYVDTKHSEIFTNLGSSEGGALCDVAAAYSTVCARRQIIVSLPAVCEEGVVPSYLEPLSPEPQLDVVVVMSEDTCDTFTYHHLARPLPQVLSRVALAKNISDVRVGVLGYGSGGGDVVYRSRGNSLLTPASQLRITQPPEAQRSQGSILQAMKAVSSFPFRPGSVRVALLLRCDARDIRKFTETLPREMVRRRLALFTLTPDTLMFNPSRPKAVRNTIGIDRWRVYNLKLDRTRSSDSWGVKRPSSNIAQLAMKSGGGVFSVSEIRRDPRARYYMKLFRRVLSKAITKVVLSTYRQQQQQQ